MSYSLKWLPKVLRDAGLKVVELDGWLLRGHGDFGKPLGVLCHHTATPGTGNFPSQTVLIKGRPDLRGPLCNLGLARDGTWYVVAAGSAWHAGRPDKSPTRGVYNGNLNLIGIEAENRGYVKGPNADPWPEVQLESYAKGVAALLSYMHQPANQCMGHKEWAPRRKVDPTFDMGAFRERVAKYMPKPTGTAKGTATRMMSLFAGPDPDDGHEDGCMCMPHMIDPKWLGDWGLAENEPTMESGMTPEMIGGTIRTILAMLSGYALAHGFDAGTWAQISAGVVGLAVWASSMLNKKDAAKKVEEAKKK